MIRRRFIKLGFVLVVLMAAGRVMGGGSAVGKDVEVRSPDGGILFLFRCKKGVPEYDVRYRGLPLIDRSPLSLTFDGSGMFGKGLVAGRVVVTEGEDKY